jgi:GNAT superfamily N-acetyltransferase
MIRPRREGDLERLVALLGAVYTSDGYPANWPNDPARWLALGRAIAAWVWEEGGELGGHIALTRPDPDRAWPQWQEALQVPPEGLAVMRRLFVAPDRRRRGIASDLLNAAKKEAADGGLHPVLDVSDDNRGAIAFWKAHGWQQVGEALLPPGDEGHPLRLVLLTGPRNHR